MWLKKLVCKNPDCKVCQEPSDNSLWDGSPAQYLFTGLMNFLKSPFSPGVLPNSSVPTHTVTAPGHPHSMTQVGEESFPNPGLTFKQVLTGNYDQREFMKKRIFLTCQLCGEKASYIENPNDPADITLEPKEVPPSGLELKLRKLLRR